MAECQTLQSSKLKRKIVSAAAQNTSVNKIDEVKVGDKCVHYKAGLPFNLPSLSASDPLTRPQFTASLLDQA